MRVADAHPEAAVVGPRLLNPDGTLQRSARGEPTLWGLATEYLFIRKLAPRTRLFNALYRGDFAHDETAEVEWLYGPALLVRREAADAVGLFDEDFFMFSEEIDWLTAVSPGRLEGAVPPRRRGRARRRRLARRAAVRREPARAAAVPRQAQGPEGGRARAPAAALVAAPAGARASARDGGTARASASSRPATPGRCSRDS